MQLQGAHVDPGIPLPPTPGPLSPIRVQAPVQDWGEETEDGAVYSVSLRRQRSQHLSRGKEGPGGGQVRPAERGVLRGVGCRVRVLRGVEEAAR